MKKLVVGTLAVAFVLGLQVSSVLAYRCPVLAKDCEAVVGKLQKRENTDKGKLATAMKMCAEALQLHEGKQHADSVIKAGEAIALAGQAAK